MHLSLNKALRIRVGIKVVLEGVFNNVNLKSKLSMKKTFLSMLLVGGSCAVFAQTTDTVPTTTQPTTTQPTMQNNMNGTTPDDKTTLASTGQYSAYSAAVNVPTSVQTQFTKEIPNAADVRWEQNANWYRATYKVGAHRMRTMYDMRGNSWSLALPVTNGLIPDDVIERAYTLYGDNVYDITILKTAPKAMTSNTTTDVNGNMNNNASVSGNATTGNNNMNANANATTGNNNMNANANATTGNNMNAGATMSTSTLNVGGTIYQVRVIENGVLRTERMNEDGTPYTEVYWRNDSLDVNQQNMNNQNMDQQNWNNNNTTDSLQQQTTDSSSMHQGTMNMNSTNQQQSTTTDDSTDQQSPSTPQSDSTNKANTDGTLPNSDPKLQK